VIACMTPTTNFQHCAAVTERFQTMRPRLNLEPASGSFEMKDCSRSYDA
jgi:hypothetical protein